MPLITTHDKWQRSLSKIMKVFTWLIIHSLIYLLRLIHDTYRLHWVFEYGRKSLLKPQTEKKNVSAKVRSEVFWYICSDKLILLMTYDTRRNMSFSNVKRLETKIVSRSAFRSVLIYLLGQNIVWYICSGKIFFLMALNFACSNTQCKICIMN